MAAPVEGYRALLESWGSDRWYCSLSYNSRKRQLTVTLVNLSHSSFTVRRYTTVKEVRLHSERGEATVTGVVGIVATMPCCDMRVTAPVTSWVRAPCVGSLTLWRGIGRSGVGVQALEGSGETELASEAKGVGRAVFWARGRGVRQAGACALVFADGLLCLLRFLLFWFGYPFLWYPTLILDYVMQHFYYISDKRFKTFKEGLMHPGLALVAEKVSSMKRPHKSDWASNPWLDDTNTIDGWS